MFQGKKLPDGREEIKGETITFVDVNRHHSGRYECIADNGYGKVSISSILYGVHLCRIYCLKETARTKRSDVSQIHVKLEKIY